jgi:hypothetical protein
MAKRLSKILATGALVLGLAGCGGNNSEKVGETEAKDELDWGDRKGIILINDSVYADVAFISHQGDTVKFYQNARIIQYNSPPKTNLWIEVDGEKIHWDGYSILKLKNDYIKTEK